MDEKNNMLIINNNMCYYIGLFFSFYRQEVFHRRVDSDRRRSEISLHKRPERELQSHWHDVAGSKRVIGKAICEKVKGQVGFEEYSTHDDRTDMIFYYRLREDIISGWEIYLIRFKNNVVFETETGVEDW